MNPSHLVTSTFESHVDEARRRAEASRRAGEARPRRRLAWRTPANPAAYAEHVVIRSAGPWDKAALAALAELDSARMPTGDTLVAEVRGELVAAIGIADGHAVADPFRPSADVVGLLRLRAGQLSGPPEGDAGGGLPALVRDRMRSLVHLPPRPERGAAVPLHAERGSAVGLQGPAR